MSLKCDSCGRFASNVYYVYGPIPQDGPSREACARCHPDPTQVAVQRRDLAAELAAAGRGTQVPQE